MGQTIGKLTDWYLRIFIVTIILYVITFLFFLIGLPCCMSDTSSCGWIWFSITIFVDGGLYICLLAMYCGALSSILSISTTDLKYWKDNSCSDSVLQYAIETFSNNYTHDFRVCGLGLAFVLVNLLLMVLNVFLFTPLRKVLSCCCVCCKERYKEPSAFERKITMKGLDLKDRLTESLKKKFSRRLDATDN